MNNQKVIGMTNLNHLKSDLWLGYGICLCGNPLLYPNGERDTAIGLCILQNFLHAEHYCNDGFRILVSGHSCFYLSFLEVTVLLSKHTTPTCAGKKNMSAVKVRHCR